jgi:uncharacterized protein (UPF0332 family)
MGFASKAVENKIVAEKCLSMKTYNVGVSRAYYSAFLHIKNYLVSKQFDYKAFLNQRRSNDKEYSHGTIQNAVVDYLMRNGKNIADIYKLNLLDDMYNKRIKADYKSVDILEVELKNSLRELDTILSIVA